ncbi:hypothetical protein ET495_06180 [Xylanimonas allomyrinae]|uniref:Uncharacterized protein n=1 Tax=Xylanimonas allomyrinae TaxID=2509459 RepID=A0A4P6EJS5_9MICO|nr:hypothetical protein [Xylanimonas allomyrinae]QAY62900.1 hypothetical protein ET495_06180 [Xylanimonas allomyrinae]
MIAAPDGEAHLYAPPGHGQPWSAFVLAKGQARAVSVAWVTPRGRRPRWTCERHGVGFRPDHCPHTRAAHIAWRIYEDGDTHD